MNHDQEEWLLADGPSPELQELKKSVEEYLAASKAYLTAQRMAVRDQLNGLGGVVEAVV